MTFFIRNSKWNGSNIPGVLDRIHWLTIRYLSQIYLRNNIKMTVSEYETVDESSEKL